MLSTFPDEFASSIRVGDRVTDSLGRSYMAMTDAEWVDDEKSYNVLTDDSRWFSYSEDAKVTIQFDSDLESTY